MKFVAIVFLLVTFLSFNISFAQQSQKQLEGERKALLSKINEIAKLKEQSKKKESSLLEQVNSLDLQINTLNDLIKLTNRQANYLTKKISSNSEQINQLNLELEELKTDYANMIVKSYKSKSNQNRLLFLLSSESFAQAYKRIVYMKQYTKFRKSQGELIAQKKTTLDSLNAQLQIQLQEKDLLVAENRASQKKLVQEKQHQQELIAQINKDQSKYAKQIKEQQKKANAIDAQIEKLIREAIAKANKKTAPTKTKTLSSKTFALTAEAKDLANKFERNKGKLPWPVARGIVTKKFGKQRHPVLKNIEINNSGVDIETQSGQEARAIFGGEVSTVRAIKGAGKLVQIRHGNYITTYYNIDNILVKEGDKVTTKQKIGTVHTNSGTGRSIMKFSIYKNSKFLNPQLWIFKM